MESEAIPKLVSLVLNPNFDEKEDIPRPGSGSSTKSGSGNPNSVSSPIKKLKIMDLELVPGTRPPPQEVEVENLHAERVKEVRYHLLVQTAIGLLKLISKPYRALFWPSQPSPPSSNQLAKPSSTLLCSQLLCHAFHLVITAFARQRVFSRGP